MNWILIGALFLAFDLAAGILVGKCMAFGLGSDK